MKSFDDKFIDDFINLLNIYALKDRVEVLNAYKSIGLIDDIEQIDDEIFGQILKFNAWSLEPFVSDSYRFEKSYLKAGVEFADFFTKKPFKPVSDYVFLDRTMHGLYSIFEQMDIEIDMRKFKQNLEKFSSTPIS
jgi:hypothetical protein